MQEVRDERPLFEMPQSELERAARNNDVNAMYELGVRFITGTHDTCAHAGKARDWLETGQRDLSQALRYYRIGSERGHALATLAVGRCHEFGWRTKQDHDSACQYYNKAKEQGCVFAEKALKRAKAGIVDYSLGLTPEDSEIDPLYSQNIPSLKTLCLVHLASRKAKGQSIGDLQNLPADLVANIESAVAVFSHLYGNGISVACAHGRLDLVHFFHHVSTTDTHDKNGGSNSIGGTDELLGRVCQGGYLDVLVYLVEVLGIRPTENGHCLYNAMLGKGPKRALIVQYLVEKCHVNLHNGFRYIWGGNEGTTDDPHHMALYLYSKGMSFCVPDMPVDTAAQKHHWESLELLLSIYGHNLAIFRRFDLFGHASCKRVDMENAVATVKKLIGFGLPRDALLFDRNLRMYGEQGNIEFASLALECCAQGIKMVSHVNLKHRPIGDTPGEVMLVAAVTNKQEKFVKSLVESLDVPVTLAVLLSACEEKEGKATFLRFFVERVGEKEVWCERVVNECFRAGNDEAIEIALKYEGTKLTNDTLTAAAESRDKVAWRLGQWWAHFNYDSYGMEHSDRLIIKESLRKRIAIVRDLENRLGRKAPVSREEWSRDGLMRMEREERGEGEQWDWPTTQEQSESLLSIVKSFVSKLFC